MKTYKLPLIKEDIDKLVVKYFDADKHVWPYWMGVGRSDNEVRYDYDGSKICYSLIRDFKPVNCLEFGTSFGHSTLFITDALLKNEIPFQFMGVEMMLDLYNKTKDNLLRRHGKLIPNLICADVMTLDDQIPQDLDFVFIDTNHELASTKWYIEKVLPKCKPGALIAIHDFAVDVDEEGNWVTKVELNEAAYDLEEYIYFRDLFKKGELPLEPLFWMYPYRKDYGNAWEGSWWIYKPKNEK